MKALGFPLRQAPLDGCRKFKWEVRELQSVLRPLSLRTFYGVHIQLNSGFMYPSGPVVYLRTMEVVSVETYLDMGIVQIRAL
jgi:hypothetical protein